MSNFQTIQIRVASAIRIDVLKSPEAVDIVTKKFNELVTQKVKDVQQQHNLLETVPQSKRSIKRSHKVAKRKKSKK